MTPPDPLTNVREKLESERVVLDCPGPLYAAGWGHAIDFAIKILDEATRLAPGGVTVKLSESWTAAEASETTVTCTMTPEDCAGLSDKPLRRPDAALRHRCEELQCRLEEARREVTALEDVIGARSQRIAVLDAENVELRELVIAQRAQREELAAAKPYQAAWEKLRQWEVDRTLSGYESPVVHRMDSLLAQPAPASAEKPEER